MNTRVSLDNKNILININIAINIALTYNSNLLNALCNEMMMSSKNLAFWCKFM